MPISLGRALSAAVVSALAVAGCAGPQDAVQSAKHACERALHSLASAEGCDAYVSEALQSKNKAEIFGAYSRRALLREFRGDLPGALADADQVIAANPEETFAHRRRAAILGESGEYQQALQSFAMFATIDPTHSFDENLAMLEYVAGDRAKSVPLFQSSAVDYEENDADKNMAANHRFTAAIIESELTGGDLAPIAAQDVSARTDTILPLLKQHRLGEVTDTELIARIEKITGPVAKDNVCQGYFSVGHRNAVAGNSSAARQAFQTAVEHCNVVTFEHHAAKAWLRQLGT
jgi:tetratricopeptide (TPR) repeat protein